MQRSVSKTATPLFILSGRRARARSCSTSCRRSAPSPRRSVIDAWCLPTRRGPRSSGLTTSLPTDRGPFGLRQTETSRHLIEIGGRQHRLRQTPYSGEHFGGRVRLHAAEHFDAV